MNRTLPRVRHFQILSVLILIVSVLTHPSSPIVWFKHLLSFFLLFFSLNSSVLPSFTFSNTTPVERVRDLALTPSHQFSLLFRPQVILTSYGAFLSPQRHRVVVVFSVLLCLSCSPPCSVVGLDHTQKEAKWILDEPTLRYNTAGINNVQQNQWRFIFVCFLPRRLLAATVWKLWLPHRWMIFKNSQCFPQRSEKEQEQKRPNHNSDPWFFLGGGWVLAAVCDDLAKVIKQEIDYQCRNVRMQSSLHCLFLQQTCPWGNVFEHNSKQQWAAMALGDNLPLPIRHTNHI